MKSRLVLWGTDPDERKVLIGLDLIEEEKQVNIYVIDKDHITAELEEQMHNEWRKGQDIPLPESKKTFDRELTLIDPILPDGYKVEREDLVKRAQTEWHFVILSSKLHRNYKDELDDLKDKIESLKDYDPNIWNNLKGFWDKVQSQIRDRNLFRGHSDQLREQTNQLFSKMKDLRKEMDKAFNEQSKQAYESISSKLNDINSRIEEGLSLHVIFEDLKKLQKEFRDMRMTKDHRNKLYDRINESFKEVKTKRFGDAEGKEKSPLDRLDKRLNGLINAIKKMEHSIKRDLNEKNKQSDSNHNVFGQLELQLREAKVKMIEERIASKQMKLDDMKKTQVELQNRREKLQERIEREKELEKAKKEAEKKIAAEIKASEKLHKEEEDKLRELAAVIKESDSKKKAEKKPKSESEEE